MALNLITMYITEHHANIAVTCNGIKREVAGATVNEIVKAMSKDDQSTLGMLCSTILAEIKGQLNA